jgi:hypothetical protein
MQGLHTKDYCQSFEQQLIIGEIRSGKCRALKTRVGFSRGRESNLDARKNVIIFIKIERDEIIADAPDYLVSLKDAPSLCDCFYNK